MLMKTLPFLLLPLLLLRVGAQGLPEVKPAVVRSFFSGVSDFHNGVIPGSPGSYFGVSEHGGAFGHGTFFSATGTGPIVRASFGLPGSGARGRNPVGQLVHDGGTFYYGVTEEGGRFGFGTVFRTTAAGAVETLVDFSGKDGAAPGFEPISGLTLGSDGNFYGILDSGPAQRGPGIFRMSPDGRYQFITDTPGGGGDDHSGSGIGDIALLARPDGTLIGALPDAGTRGNGTIFRLNADGTLTTLAGFTGEGGALPGANPAGRPIAATDGTIYGIGQSRNGVQQGSAGFIWKIDPAGTPSILATFDFQSGPFLPRAPLAFDTNGDLLVVFGAGGSNGRGGFFRVTPAGAISQIQPFDGSASGDAIMGFVQFGLVLESGSNYITTTDEEIVQIPIAGVVNIVTMSSPDAGTSQGTSPSSPVIFTPSGTLHAQTRSGGANRRGVVVKKLPAGSPTVLASLPADYVNFQENFLAIDLSENVLVTDRFGGGNGGRILQITQAGALTTRASFNDFSEASGVFNPAEGLAHDGAGTFYGLGFAVAPGGTGPNRLAAYRLSGGSILRINPAPGLPAIGGSFDSFSGPLVPLDSNHYLGVLERDDGGGKVFRLGMGGNVSTFASLGGFPFGPVLAEAGGTFLLPVGSGSNDDVVSIMRLSNSGNATKLGQITERFASENAWAPLAKDTQNRIYGVLEDGGVNQSGVLYRIDTDGTARKLYEFPVNTDFDNAGTNPSAGLTFNPADGAIYGVAGSGGQYGGGTIFKIFTTPQGSAFTPSSPDTLDAHSAAFVADINSNGYNVEFWFVFGLDSGNPDMETAHQFAGGFHGTDIFPVTLTGLKGHRTYFAELKAKIGFGTDAIEVSGGQVSFTTPNGAPIALNDTILVTTQNIGDEFTGDVLDNDTDLDDDPVTIQSFTQGAFGTVTQDGSTLKYTPTQAFFDNGSRDTFSYTIQDDQAPALTSTATVDVLFSEAVAGQYAGLLFDDPDASAIPREIALIPSPDQIAAGFAQMALTSGRRFSARFQIGGRSFASKGTMEAGRGTRFNSGRDFSGSLRTTPAGLEARITFNGRTLILRAGQAFAAVPGAERPASDFTMRFDPTQVSDPTNDDGLPAGSGFAVVRQGATARARIVGTLPEGTAFSASSIIDPDGKLPFQSRLKKGKAGTFDAELILDTDNGTVEPVAGTTARWSKPSLATSKRFPGGFSTKMTPFGGKHTVPAKNTPPFDLMGGQLAATFDRGGLLSPLESRFTFTGAKAVIVPGSDNALATAKFVGRTGFVSGTFKPFGKPVKYRAILIQRDKSAFGFFLGTADAGSVQMMTVP